MEEGLLISSIVVLVTICVQDIKHRQVHVWLLMLCSIVLTALHIRNAALPQLLISGGLNFFILFLVLLVLFFYARIILKERLRNIMGLGDAAFFLILALSFPTIAFVVIFSFSLVFALLIFLIIKPYLNDKTVPLAGLQALFVAVMLSGNAIFNFTNLYLL